MSNSHTHASRPLSLKQIPSSLLLLTVGRLAFVPAIIVALSLSPLLTFGLLGVFIAMDLYDGVLARQLEADDPARRALDSIVDRLSIWPVYAATVFLGWLPPALFVLMLGRDIYCAYLCHGMVRQRAVAIRADWFYRSLNLMLAAWVVAAPLIGSSARAWTFILVFMFSLIVAADLRRAVKRIMQMPIGDVPMVLSASSLRPGKTARELSASGGPVSLASPVHS